MKATTFFMNPSIRRIAQFLLQETPSIILTPLHLSQLHSQLITTGLHSHPTAPLLSLLKLYLSNTSTLPQATTLFPQIQNPNKWNLMIRHKSATNPLKALSFFQEMMGVGENNTQNLNFHHDPFVYASVVKACGKVHAFMEGKSIHCRVIRVGLDYNVNILNSLVSFYLGSVNSTSYAVVLFDMISEKSVVSVNCMMSGHVRRGNFDVGLSLFVKMLRGCFGSSVKPNYVTFVVLISGCAEVGGLRTANALHCCCCKKGLIGNIEICNVLIDLYSKFGCIFDAGIVFRDMPEKDLISWNTMIWGYANNSDHIQAFYLFRKMRFEDIGLDRVSFSSLISACAGLKDLFLGTMIHAHVKKIRLERDVSVGTALIHMYAKCRKVEAARDLFDELPKQNVEFWNSIMHAYIEGGLAREALKLFDQIKSRKLEPDEVTILGVIRACRDTGEIDQGVFIHSIVESNEIYKGSIVLLNALIDMYAKCGSMEQARAVFDRMPHKDVISWTSIIVGHAINGEGVESLAAFKQMCAEKVVPNSITFLGVLLACDHAGLVDEGRKLYGIMCEDYHIKPQIEHYGCVVDMLARAGKLEDAKLFIQTMPIKPNALIWRMLINACKVHSHVDLGLNLVTGITELSTSRDSADHVISSSVFAEAGRWGDVISHRNFMVLQKVSKVAGKSSLSC